MQVIKQINNCEYFYKNYISAFKSQKKKEILHSSLLKKKKGKCFTKVMYNQEKYNTYKRKTLKTDK